MASPWNAKEKELLLVLIRFRRLASEAGISQRDERQQRQKKAAVHCCYFDLKAKNPS